MKLLAKFGAILTAALLLLMTFEAVGRIQRIAAREQADMLRDHQFVGRTLRATYVSVFDVAGEARADEVIRIADRGYPPIFVRVVHPDDPAPTRLAAARRHAVAAHPGEYSFEFGDRLVTGFPMSELPGPPRVLELSEPLDVVHASIHAVSVQVAVTSIRLVSITALLAAVLGAWMIGRPVRQLIAKTRRIAAGHPNSPLIVSRRRDELGELAREINAMAEQLARKNAEIATQTEARIATLDQLRHADRLRSVGQFAAGLAHELGTPLGVVRGRAQLLRGGEVPAAEVTAYASIIEQQSDRMATLIRQLLDFAGRRATKPTRTNLHVLAEAAVELLRPFAQKQRTRIVIVAPAEPVCADVEAPLIDQVVTNLVLNAVQAMVSPGTVEIAVDVVRATPPPSRGGPTADHARIEVRDDGPGIAPDDLNRIFEPFFTTKDVGAGTGLGLSITHAIVEDHGGWIAVQSAPGAGSRFSVYLPLAAAAAPRGASAG